MELAPSEALRVHSCSTCSVLPLSTAVGKTAWQGTVMAPLAARLGALIRGPVTPAAIVILTLVGNWKEIQVGWVWQSTPLILAHRRQRPGDL